MEDVLQLILFAVEEGGEREDHDKTAFYVAGGVLALWAVLVSLVAFTKSDFATERGLSRIVIAITAVLMLVTMATSILTS